MNDKNVAEWYYIKICLDEQCSVQVFSQIQVRCILCCGNLLVCVHNAGAIQQSKVSDLCSWWEQFHHHTCNKGYM